MFGFKYVYAYIVCVLLEIKNVVCFKDLAHIQKSYTPLSEKRHLCCQYKTKRTNQTLRVLKWKVYCN